MEEHQERSTRNGEASGRSARPTQFERQLNDENVAAAFRDCLPSGEGVAHWAFGVRNPPTGSILLFAIPAIIWFILIVPFVFEIMTAMIGKLGIIGGGVGSLIMGLMMVPGLIPMIAWVTVKQKRFIAVLTNQRLIIVQVNRQKRVIGSMDYSLDRLPPINLSKGMGAVQMTIEDSGTPVIVKFPLKDAIYRERSNSLIERLARAGAKVV